MPDWLVATAENGRQRLARASCEERGFVCYFPLLRERKLVRGRKRSVTSYLFGRYFFVVFHPQWIELRTTRGVDDVFRYDEHPALVRDGTARD
jgi:Transcription termination factor nusG